MDEHKDITLFKYADDSTVLVTISRDLPDKSEIAQSKFMEWTNANSMHCNTSSCKKLVLHKRGNTNAYPLLHNIKQYSNISLLRLTIRSKVIVSLGCILRKSSMRPTSVHLESEACLRKDTHKEKQIVCLTRLCFQKYCMAFQCMQLAYQMAKFSYQMLSEALHINQL